MKTTMLVIDAAFEMVAICKKPFPVEGSPEFFALTDAVHKLECACLAYKAERLRPTDGPGDSAMLDWLEGELTNIYQNKPQHGRNLENVEVPQGVSLRKHIRAAMQSQEGAK